MFFSNSMRQNDAFFSLLQALQDFRAFAESDIVHIRTTPPRLSFNTIRKCCMLLQWPCEGCEGKARATESAVAKSLRFVGWKREPIMKVCKLTSEVGWQKYVANSGALSSEEREGDEEGEEEESEKMSVAIVRLHHHGTEVELGAGSWQDKFRLQLCATCSGSCKLSPL